MRTGSIIKTLLASAAVCFAALSATLRADTVHKTYFENTDFELHVYEIVGREPGPTMLIIGGIQGDEPGSYLAADLYADISLRKGTLIVVPRANFYAILLNERGPNGDMNRQFARQEQVDYEARIVKILKELINRSDVLLNLHDGNGFFREQYMDDKHNPMLFGQSIIADADEYVGPASGKRIELGKIARKICEVVNHDIPDEEYRFRFNNHNTQSDKTLHPEQRLSATYYSLTHHEIPAFGVESSKEIPSNEIKVQHKAMIINAFMNEFGILPENPKILVEKPTLNHLIVLINDSERVALKDGETLLLNPGDRIIVEHVDMNYTRGLAADIIGVGGMNDLNKSFSLDYPTRVVIRKDSFKCATVNIAINKAAPRVAPRIPRVVDRADRQPRLEFLTILVDGQRHEVSAGATLDVPLGAVLEITEAVIDKPSSGKELQVNFKGFVGDPVHNSGEDRGFKIPTDRGLMKKYSTDGRGIEYPIVVSCKGEEIGSVNIRLVGQRAEASQ
jgi:hypothetical protein